MMACSRASRDPLERTVTCFLSRSATAAAVPGTALQAFSTAAVPLYYLWEDCPVLADLELPQELGGLALARRGLWGDELTDRIQAGIELWEAMTAGAE